MVELCWCLGGIHLLHFIFFSPQVPPAMKMDEKWRNESQILTHSSGTMLRVNARRRYLPSHLTVVLVGSSSGGRGIPKRAVVFCSFFNAPHGSPSVRAPPLFTYLESSRIV